MKLSLRMVAVSAMTALVVGCSSTERPTTEELYEKSPIPRSEKTVSQIYKEHGSGANSNVNDGRLVSQEGYLVNKRVATPEEVSINPYVLNNTAKADFKKLPNPTLYILFMPSLTKEDRMPRPAWMSEFKMYDRDEYALPGEMSFSGGVR